MGISQRWLRLDAIKLNAENILFTSNIPNASSLLSGRDKKGGVRNSAVFESSSFLPLDLEAANRERDDYENHRKLTIDQHHRIGGLPGMSRHPAAGPESSERR